MEKKTSKNIWLCILGVLVIVSLVSRILVIQTYPLAGAFLLASLVCVALYGFWLYKKPHGNMLRYAMLLFAFTGILSSATYLMYSQHWYEVTIILACAAVCYGAGRLDRINQNKILFPIIDIVLILSLICCYITVKPNSIVWKIAFFNLPISFTALMVAYFARYKEHKEAGLTDVPKAK